MKKSSYLGFCIALFTWAAQAQECTDRWNYFFDTDPLHLKVISGDTSAGYAFISYWGDPTINFEIHGEYPRVRFLSFETQNTRVSISEDALFDFQIEPDKGSENPFREGNYLDLSNRNYSLVATQRKTPGAINTLSLPNSPVTQSIIMRLYSPNEGVRLTSADLPRIFAVDAETGRPAACPRDAFYPVRFYFPQFLADLYTMVKPFEFKVPESMSVAGLNQAAGYMYAVTELARSEVVLIRFQPPSFADTRSGTGLFPVGSQVRYWSFCTNNFPNNETLNCLPDFLATPQADGYVYVVVGTGSKVEEEALSRGYNFLPDAREWRQRVMGFVYRNLVPQPDFKANEMYKGKFAPETRLCPSSEFLSGNCSF